MTDSLQERAVTLRRSGKSRREIKETLGITDNWQLNKLLAGEPPQEWTKRPNAKDGLRDRARELRLQGWSYKEIARELGVSQSSCSLWLRDLPKPERLEGVEFHQQRQEAARVKHWEPLRQQRATERANAKLHAGNEIGELTEREVLMAGAIAYWCEGAKDKPYRRSEQVTFINSDPDVIRFFLKFLHVAGVERERLRFRVHIHETADVGEASRHWAEVARADLKNFQKPVIKRHDPRTNRKNLIEQYRGCLEVRVLQSAELYRKIEGWAYGTMLARPHPLPMTEPERELERQRAASGEWPPDHRLPRRLALWRRPRYPRG